MKAVFAIAALLAAACVAPGSTDAGIFWVGDGTTLNARSGPGTGHARMTQLRPGTRLHELERRHDWSRVLLGDGSEVWVHNGYIVDHSAFMQGRTVDSCVGIAGCGRVFTCNDNTDGIRTKPCFFVDV
ncbi:MAG: SH3 domain-containing protein, partial [Boseongicola sp. SB0677_bin_26]|nr:SH3 domain-containing protein [Boseongicola sp. SB0677_bin_26]